MSNYKYICPTERGYTKLTMSTREYETLIGRKVRNRKTCYREVYALKNSKGNTHYLIHTFVRTYIKVLATVTFPILLVIHGLTSFKELTEEIKDLWNEKESGHYTGDSFTK